MSISYKAGVIPPHKWIRRQAVQDQPVVESPTHKDEFLPHKHGGRVKLTESDIPAIRELLARGLLHRKIAERFGVSEKTIGHINTGRRWWWVK